MDKPISVIEKWDKLKAMEPVGDHVDPIKSWLEDLYDAGDRLRFYANWVKRLENYEDINFHQRGIIATPKRHYDKLKENSEKWSYFIQGADKDTALDLSAWMSDVHKVESARKHFLNFKNPYAGICNDCPYPLELKTLEGNCGRCAGGTFKFWGVFWGLTRSVLLVGLSPWSLSVPFALTMSVCLRGNKEE
jgi:hypothetical protein